MTTASELTTVLLFAVLVEMLVEYFVKPLLPQPEEDAEPQWWQTLPYSRYAAATLGVALCIAYRLDILAMLALDIRATYLGMALTGLLISRGANCLHDWIANPIVKRLVS